MPFRLLILPAAVGLAALAADTLAGKAPAVTTPAVAAAIAPKPASRPIDLALCLDTSGSMDGLIESAKQKRTELQDSVQRDAFVREAMKAQAIDENQSFDAALRRAIREQAATRGFSFPTELPSPPPAPAADVAVKTDGC
jgi:hypothetical protein